MNMLVVVVVFSFELMGVHEFDVLQSTEIITLFVAQIISCLANEQFFKLALGYFCQDPSGHIIS